MPAKCTHCKGPLKAIGNARSNGKDHSDWFKRELHKKCWKEKNNDAKYLWLAKVMTGKDTSDDE